jgi:hypothetical protein
VRAIGVKAWSRVNANYLDAEARAIDMQDKIMIGIIRRLRRRPDDVFEGQRLTRVALQVSVSRSK